jgi:signal transduction histidine kinase
LGGAAPAGRPYAKLLAENENLKRSLSEALEQQTATSEILRAISASPTDLQPVLNTVATSAARFCGAYDAILFQLDAGRLREVAHHGPIASRRARPALAEISRGTVRGRAFLERRAIHVADLLNETDEFPEGSEDARELGHRTILSVPLLRKGTAIGVITLRRTEVDPFTDQQVTLLQTFASQAVIAIENVRLFNETKEALEQQTATSEVLRVIGQSPTDVQPVFDAIVQSAVRLCNADNAAVFLTDGQMVYHPANYGSAPEALATVRAMFPRPLDMSTPPGIAILTRSVVQVPDIEDPSAIQAVRPGGRLLGFRSVVMVPMLRESEPVGSLGVARREPGQFSEAEVGLLKAFADQAVIAIENVRLFTELQEKNRALTDANAQVTEALEQQTATSEILRVISSSPTDEQPVFDTIVRTAARLCDAFDANLLLADGDEFVQRAHHGPIGAPVQDARYPLRGTVSGRAISEARMIQVDDLAAATEYPLGSELAQRIGYRTTLIVPLVRDGLALGAIAIRRTEVKLFTNRQIALLQTFANQAVISIENVRLFKELEAANRGLSAASQHKSEFLANMSHELRTPLNAIIGYSELLEEEAEGLDGGRLVPDLQKIATAAKHQLSLINDILDLSKVEAGRMELEVADFDLPMAIDNALTLVRERATRRGIALGSAIDERVGTIRADERKVKQVLLNLLSNALKFTRESGRIAVRAAVNGQLVEVSVADTGVGIAPEDQEAVFEEFRQVGTADKKVEGTGLGLALARKFVELHGGRIRVKSQPGLGSTFTFTLPARGEE